MKDQWQQVWEPQATAAAYAEKVLYYTKRWVQIYGLRYVLGWKSNWMDIGRPLAEQAKGPFLNPMEQDCQMPHVCVQGHQIRVWLLYRLVWGNDVFSVRWPHDINNACSKEDGEVLLSSGDQAKVTIATIISQDQLQHMRGQEKWAIYIKYDDYLKGKPTLTAQRYEGLTYSRVRQNAQIAMYTLFTDLPTITSNTEDPMNPFYYEKMWNGMGGGIDWIDPGLGGFLETIHDRECGK